jgi:hypothetical protein
MNQVELRRKMHRAVLLERCERYVESTRPKRDAKRKEWKG